MNLILSDEAALVKGACNLGYVFASRTPDAVTIDVVRFTMMLYRQMTC